MATAPAGPSGPSGPGRIALQGGDLPVGTASSVRVNRPVDAAAVADEATSPDPEDPPPTLPPDAPALLRFAAPFEAPQPGRPPLSVVLLDQGALAAATAAEALSDLPVPVTVAIDPVAPDAAERMAAYRALGIEVLALLSLPSGAQPVDAAVSVEAVRAILPEAVGVLDLGRGGLEAGSATAAPALGRLAEEGLGALLLDGGLGATARSAEAAGVPTATVMRDLDGAGQDAATMRRFLDDAARRAGQADRAVVLARVRSETLAALAAWAAGRRAGEVTLAPLSAVLRAAP